MALFGLIRHLTGPTRDTRRDRVAGPSPSIRILVLAPTSEIRRRFTAAAEGVGGTVVARANTWTARFAVTHTVPDLVIVEWPENEGHRRAVVRFLHSLDIHNCLVLAVVPPDEPDTVAAALASGADDAVVTAADDDMISTRLEVLAARVRSRMSRAAARTQLETDYQRLIEATGTESDGLFDWDLIEGVFTGDRRMLEILEADAPQSVSHPGIWLDAVHPDDRQHLESVIRATRDGDLRLLEHRFRLNSVSGPSTAIVRAQVIRDENGTATRFVGRFSRLDETISAESGVLACVLHDPLTSLPNRVVLLDRLRSKMRQAVMDPSAGFSVLFFDLNRFKTVNDGLGHLRGDQLLRAVGDRVRSACRPNDLLARFAGDEFVIIADAVTTSRDAVAMASRIHGAMSEPFDLQGTEVFASVSIGIAVWDPTYTEPEDLLRDADTAMYRAKAKGRDMTAVFDEAMRQHAVAMLELENDLRRAIAREEFRPYFQPIVFADGSRIAGFEALARWEHPTRGLLEPAAFIGVAEELGLIIAIDRLIAHEACQHLRAWRASFKDHAGLSLAVNISSTQFMQPDLVPQVDLILRQSGLYGSSLTVEVTESVLMENAQHAEAMLEQLRKLDIGISIDDFGTGYSSLAYLRRFEIDTLKIDHGFVSRMLFDQESSEIVRTIVNLARNLDKESVAEGVETRSQFEAIQRLGVDLVQGYYIAPPMPADRAADLLRLTAGAPNHLGAIISHRLNEDTVIVPPSLDEDIDDLFSEAD